MTPRTGSVKLMMAVFAGAESEIDRLTDALPPLPPPLVFAPLQEVRENAASKSVTVKTLRRFMKHPTNMVCVFLPHPGKTWERPRLKVTCRRKGGHSKNETRCSTAKDLEPIKIQHPQFFGWAGASREVALVSVLS